MKIMIADDHPLYVEALENLLRSDFEIVGKVNNGVKAVEEAARKRPDVILMDLNMPDMSGIEATKLINAKMPEIKIVILTSFEEKESLFRAVKAGAVGYLLKNLNGEEIITGLQELGQGRNPFAPGMERHLLDEFKENYTDLDLGMPAVADELSDRQLKVLELLAKGLTYREIGKLLFITERTVKYHVERLKDCLDLKSHEQLVAYAWERGFPKS